jgi:beta-lactamase class D
MRIRTIWRVALLGGICLAATGSARAHEVCTLLAEVGSGRTVLERGACDRRVTPASTFKIAISLMGYESGFLKDEHNPALPFRDGYPDWLPAWRQTTDPARWIQYSVVWYSQQVTRALGEERFGHFVRAFGYGNQDVSGDPGRHNGLTRAWLSSSLAISPREQVAFLTRLVQRTLPVSARAVAMTSRITRIAESPAGWDLHGKTGSGFPVRADGTRDQAHGYGWFVGWATKAGRTVVFARLIQNEREETGLAGIAARESLLADFPALVGAAAR